MKIEFRFTHALIVTAILALLKLTIVPSISWFWVLSPFWIPFSIIVWLSFIVLVLQLFFKKK